MLQRMTTQRLKFVLRGLHVQSYTNSRFFWHHFTRAAHEKPYEWYRKATCEVRGVPGGGQPAAKMHVFSSKMIFCFGIDSHRNPLNCNLVHTCVKSENFYRNRFENLAQDSCIVSHECLGYQGDNSRPVLTRGGRAGSVAAAARRRSSRRIAAGTRGAARVRTRLNNIE